MMFNKQFLWVVIWHIVALQITFNLDQVIIVYSPTVYCHYNSIPAVESNKAYGVLSQRIFNQHELGVSDGTSQRYDMYDYPMTEHEAQAGLMQSCN